MRSDEAINKLNEALHEALDQIEEQNRHIEKLQNALAESVAECLKLKIEALGMGPVETRAEVRRDEE